MSLLKSLIKPSQDAGEFSVSGAAVMPVANVEINKIVAGTVSTSTDDPSNATSVSQLSAASKVAF